MMRGSELLKTRVSELEEFVLADRGIHIMTDNPVLKPFYGFDL